MKARESGLLPPEFDSITCAWLDFLRLRSRNMEASRPMTRPATAQPTAIPTTAPVLSPLPDVGAEVAEDGVLVIWVSGMIEEVEIPEVEVGSRLRLDTGRFDDSCEAELLRELGAGSERIVGL